MPPKKTTAAASAGRRAAASKAASKSKPAASKTANPRPRTSNASTGQGSARGSNAAREVVTIDSDEDEERVEESDYGMDDAEDESEEETRTTVPPELITRVLHEFFTKEGTRITRDANEAVVKYVDVFVREAIARTAAERGEGFLEVEDLEKVTPQLLMDL
ncbi:CENP-S associating centromere protein X-domain-containing protein [Cercophora newfieldiana]|uniref:CENP-S associating centromere protein X-domain-containing protein n=1 Tax=Cercophora newfieldiana TaxID=92897 RepID=A0AA39XU47_9PEZI|nr:CENP-S associating centromere protein X-domain-containing protein [Cercophora newfieldiana]